jgi:hypothetical protein
MTPSLNCNDAAWQNLPDKQERALPTVYSIDFSQTGGISQPTGICRRICALSAWLTLLLEKVCSEKKRGKECHEKNS